MADTEQNEVPPIEEAAPEAERPDWLDPKFPTVEEQARGYHEAQKLIERRGNEANALQAELDELTQFVNDFQAPAPAQQQGLNDNPLVARYSRAFEEGDVAEMLRVQAELSQAVAQQNAPKMPEADHGFITAFAENQIRASNPDYDQYRDRTVEVLQANPQLIPQGATLDVVQQGITNAFHVARGQELAAERQAQADSDAQAEAGRQAKLAAQTVPSGGTRPQQVDQQSDLWDQIKGAKTNTFTLPG